MEELGMELSKSLEVRSQEVVPLLQAIHDDDLGKTKDELAKVLRCIEKHRKQDRKSRRHDRVALYDKLLLLALGGEVFDRADKYSERPPDKIKADSGSISRYLLDQIHETDDIVLKFYHDEGNFKESLKEKASRLVQSIEWYRMDSIDPTLDTLANWILGRRGDGEKVEDLLARAKREFKQRLGLEENRSWRYRARMYWLLTRVKAPVISTLLPLLVQEILVDHHKILIDHDHKNGTSLIEESSKFVVYKGDKVNLGIFRSSSLLACASAIGDYDLVESILKSKERFRKSNRCGQDWEEAWKRALANALWNAAYKGHAQIVQALLECTELYPSQYYSDYGMVPPLHVAVLRGHSLVVKAFCAESERQKTTINCHENGHRELRQTPLEVATNLKIKEDTKRTIQGLLLQSPQVKQALDESYRKRDLIVNSANAIMVGSALIAGVSFGGWLQPPLGYHTYYQFTEPLPAPPDTYDSYLFVQGRTSIRVFAISNSISFFFAIASMVAGMWTFMAATMDATIEDRLYMENTVKKLLRKLRATTYLFIVSVVFVLIAFGSAAIAILPPITTYRRDMYITIAVGGIFCVVVIGMMLWKTLRMSKKVRKLPKCHGRSSDRRSSSSRSTSQTDPLASHAIGTGDKQ